MIHHFLGHWAVATVATALALVLVPIARQVALNFGVTDRPSPRKLHLGPTPYLGGLAVTVTVLGTSVFLPHWQIEASIIVLAATSVATVGLIDDLRTLSPWPRLAVEAAAATAAVGAGTRLHVVGGPLDQLATIGLIVVVTNSFNLLDNMDGCASAIAAATGLVVVVSAELQGQVLLAGLAAVTAGSAAGFLAYNWHPARVFMGDAGSLFLGFLISVVAIRLRFEAGAPTRMLATLLILGLPLFDTMLVVVSRLSSGRPVLSGGTDHTSHRLLRHGLSIPVVAAAMAATALMCAGLGLGIGSGALPSSVALPAAVVGLFFFVRLLRTSDGELMTKVSAHPSSTSIAVELSSAVSVSTSMPSASSWMSPADASGRTQAPGSPGRGAEWSSSGR